MPFRLRGMNILFSPIDRYDKLCYNTFKSFFIQEKAMAFCYKKLWHQLIDHDMSRTDLRDATGMAPATLAKLSKGEAVGTPTLEKICRVLQCNIGDIMDYVPDEPENKEGKGLTK